jgi:hypothetical protein
MDPTGQEVRYGGEGRTGKREGWEASQVGRGRCGGGEDAKDGKSYRPVVRTGTKRQSQAYRVLGLPVTQTGGPGTSLWHLARESERQARVAVAWWVCAGDNAFPSVAFVGPAVHVGFMTVPIPLALVIVN